MTKIIASLLFAATTLLAAEGSWADVMARRPNEKIQVVKRDRKSLRGEVVGVDSGKITLTVGG